MLLAFGYIGENKTAPCANFLMALNSSFLVHYCTIQLEFEIYVDFYLIFFLFFLFRIGLGAPCGAPYLRSYMGKIFPQSENDLVKLDIRHTNLEICVFLSFQRRMMPLAAPCIPHTIPHRASSSLHSASINTFGIGTVALYTARPFLLLSLCP